MHIRYSRDYQRLLEITSLWPQLTGTFMRSLFYQAKETFSDIIAVDFPC